MSWHGIGLISGNSTFLPAMQNLYGALPALRPGADWDGTAASGFAAAPTDPTRTTAKPAVRLLTPPAQWFTDTLDVGAMAMANDDGSLMGNFGIDRVEFIYEGRTLAVARPRWHTINTQRGPRTYFGWWARLKKPASISGDAHLYIRAVARDATMQDRVIGPYFFCPRDQQYSHQITIAPSLPEVVGERYQTLDPATAWLNQQNSINPLITITEPGTYNMLGGSGNLGGYPNTMKNFTSGRLNITASVPGVVIGRTEYTNDASAVIREARYRLHLIGPNLSLDFTNVTTIISDGTEFSGTGGTAHWLDGVTCFNTGTDGAQTLWRGVPVPRGGISSWGYLTECEINDIANPCLALSLVRGCTIRRAAYDIFNQTRCIIDTALDENPFDILFAEVPAFTVQYTGAEATATLARPGGTLQFGVWTLTIGADTYTFDTGIGSAFNPQNFNAWNGTYGDGYWISDVVDWLNTFPDITATLLIDESNPRFKRHTSTVSLPGQEAGFNARDIKAAPLSLISTIKYHGDYYQHATGELSNIIVAFNTAKRVHFQTIFLSPIDNPPVNDVFFVGNALALDMTPVGGFHKDLILSQVGRSTGMAGSHIVFMHNTISNQAVSIRTIGVPAFTMDEYCIFRNNSFAGFGNDVGAPMPNLRIEDLHVYVDAPLNQGAAVPHSGINQFRRGSAATLFVDPASDLTPTALMRDVGFAPVIPFDLHRTPFPALAAPGAIAAPALALYDEAAAVPSDNPLADLLALLNATGGLSSVHDYANATLSGGVFTSLDMTTNGNHHGQTSEALLPHVVTEAGVVFTGGSQTIAQAVTAGSSMTAIVAFAKNAASNDGVIISDNSGFHHCRYQSSGTWLAGSGQVSVNGNRVDTAIQLFNALNVPNSAVVSLRNISTMNRNAITIGRSAGPALAGTVRWAIMLDEVALGASLPQALLWAEQVASFAPAAAPPSLYSTVGFTRWGPASHAEVLGIHAFRGARDAITNGGWFVSAVPPGNYRFRGTLSAYDGAISGITVRRMIILDGSTTRATISDAGAFDVTVAINNGSFRFAQAAVGHGFRVDDLLIEPV